MLITVIWGTKIKTHDVGVVADYCPICRDPRAFTLREYCEAGHLYFVSATRGTPFKYTAVCKVCGVEKSPSTGLTSRAIELTHPITIEELIELTYPELESKKRKTIERNDRLREDPHSFTSAERLKLVQEPFAVMDSAVSDKQEGSSHRQTHPITYLGVVCAIAFLAVAAVFFTKWLERGGGGNLVVAITGLLIAGAAGIGAYLGEIVGLRKLYYPILARAYAPLSPSLEELRSGFLASTSNISKKINAEHLFQYLQLNSRRPHQ